jgi:anti-sigma regulatory factor (Ser/Thr protein kinase)
MTDEHHEADREEAVHVDLPADPTAARTARRQTRAALRRWRLPELVDSVVLAVSELVGNAIRHGRPPVVLMLRRTPRALRVEVHDEAPAQDVVRRDASSSAESGRGLMIVDAVSGETGVEDLPGDGKTVWARFDA